VSAFKRYLKYTVLLLASVFLYWIMLWMGVDAEAELDARGAFLVGLLFMVACGFGMTLALWPGWPRRNGDARGNEVRRPGEALDEAGPPRRGHHPDCEPFSGHTFMLGEGVRCAGCTGLMAGCVAAIALMALHLADLDAIDPVTWSRLGGLGSWLVLLGVGLSKYRSVRGRTSVALNAAFVVGLFLAVAGVMGASGEWTYGMIAVVLCFLWLETRMVTSQWHHVTVCARCPEACKAYL
jgi:hypothetical protein